MIAMLVRPWWRRAMPEMLHRYPSPNMFRIFVMCFWAIHVDTIFFVGTADAASEAGGRDYASLCSNATGLPLMQEYDYIVVGGGTAGCPLAATLSQRYAVLLLERGGLPLQTNVVSAEGFLATLLEVDEYTSPAQAFASEEGVSNARGRVLGGSTAINAGFYSRAGARFVREAGWDAALVNGSYDWVERALVARPALRPWQRALRDGLIQAGVRPYNGYTLHHLPGTKIGGSTFDRHGIRHTAADLLRYADGEALTVGLRAAVTRILFEGGGGGRPRAYGVEYRDGDGVVHVAVLNSGGGEVILSAGALGSPQLLMLSGVGPAEHLAAMGILPALDMPAVGSGMADNPRNGIAVVSPVPLKFSLIQVVGVTESGSFIEASSNSFWIPRWAGGGGGGSDANYDGNPSGYVHVGSILAKVPGPRSTGQLRLRTPDVRDNPSVSFNYFSDPRDLESCVSGMRTIARVLQTNALSAFGWPQGTGDARAFRFIGGSQLPENVSDDASMEAFCRQTVSTIWHYHGGCQVGEVVDDAYRVIGVDSLRVVDGSVFNSSPGTNPQATLMMLGRYMGLKILEERSAGSDRYMNTTGSHLSSQAEQVDVHWSLRLSMSVEANFIIYDHNSIELHDCKSRVWFPSVQFACWLFARVNRSADTLFRT